MSLIDLCCPICSLTLSPLPTAAVKAATCFGDCLRRCDVCGIGFSNARNNPVLIYADYHHNVPLAVRNGLEEVIANSFNQRNRNNKRVKFAFSTSEDAVTWTIFKYLSRTSCLNSLITTLDILPASLDQNPGEILLWGVSLTTPVSSAGREHLEAISNSIGEARQSRSEPDVILDFGNRGVVFIEVKYRSKNEVRQDTGCFDKYIDGTDVFQNPDIIKESGCYELARNWRIGTAYAGSRPFVLVNLVLDSLINNKANRKALDHFASGLRTSDSMRFVEIGWSRFIACIPQPIELWLDEYIVARSLNGPAGKGII